VLVLPSDDRRRCCCGGEGTAGDESGGVRGGSELRRPPGEGREAPPAPNVTAARIGDLGGDGDPDDDAAAAAAACSGEEEEEEEEAADNGWGCDDAEKSIATATPPRPQSGSALSPRAGSGDLPARWAESAVTVVAISSSLRSTCEG
jgi:hypothetical protein